VTRVVVSCCVVVLLDDFAPHAASGEDATSEKLGHAAAAD
jgi:hypothetical protein